MLIRFERTELVDAPPERMFSVLTTYEAYPPPPLLQLERRYAGNPTARSTWTVEPAFGGRSSFTITAELTAPGPLGVLLRPVLWRMFHQLAFAPFIQAAQPRATASAAKRPVS